MKKGPRVYRGYLADTLHDDQIVPRYFKLYSYMPRATFSAVFMRLYVWEKDLWSFYVTVLHRIFIIMSVDFF